MKRNLLQSNGRYRGRFIGASRGGPEDKGWGEVSRGAGADEAAVSMSIWFPNSTKAVGE